MGIHHVDVHLCSPDNTNSLKTTCNFKNRLFVHYNCKTGLIDKMVGRIFYSPLITYLCSTSKVMNKKNAIIAAVKYSNNMVQEVEKRNLLMGF